MKFFSVCLFYPDHFRKENFLGAGFDSNCILTALLGHLFLQLCFPLWCIVLSSVQFVFTFSKHNFSIKLPRRKVSILVWFSLCVLYIMRIPPFLFVM